MAQRNMQLLAAGLVAVAVIGLVMLFKLGSLTGGLSASEVQAANQVVGWHGLFREPFYLPLKLIQSVCFWLRPNHGQFLTRLPNAVLGGLTCLEFITLVRLWHGRRIAWLGGALFITAAWVLHSSRLASFDVSYLWLLPTLLLANGVLNRFGQRRLVWQIYWLGLTVVLYIPGAIWFVLIEVWFSRRLIIKCWQQFKSWRTRLLTAVLPLLLSLFLLFDLSRPGQLKQWLGLPTHFASAKLLLKHFVAVPVHLFVRGPEYPTIWLAKAPVLDVFTLAVCLIGLFFYAQHLGSSRAKRLALFLAFGWILIALGGAVPLSVLVSLLYIVAATGVAFLLQKWLRVFPINPVVRSLGIILLSLMVVAAALYNLRAYFVAWPHNPTTVTTFRYRR